MKNDVKLKVKSNMTRKIIHNKPKKKENKNEKKK